MRLLFILFLISINCFPLKDKIAGYILNDIDTNLTYQWRLKYDEGNNQNWSNHSKTGVTLNFPRIKKYLDIDPNLEFIHVINHVQSDSQNSLTQTRITQAYIAVYQGFGTITIGEKRLSLQNGRFLSDSNFNLLPKTFGHIGYNSEDNQYQIMYLYNYVDSNSTDRVTFQKGSIIAAARNLFINKNHSVSIYSYFLEDINNVYSAQINTTLTDDQSVQFTYAYQTKPLFYTNSIITDTTPNSHYYDFSYKLNHELSTFSFGSRYFQGHSDNLGFRAPYSSGHSWDGYSNQFQSQITTGFNESFRSIYSKFQTILFDNRKVSIHGYLFRNSDLSKNLGAEIDLTIQQEIFMNHFFFNYKLAQYFSGTHQIRPSELKMWLDFKLVLGSDD